MKIKMILVLVPLFFFVGLVNSWNEGPGSVLLRDVQVLTLYRGRYTAARRSSPIPQLQCVGGSAGCGAFAPEVVQCHNKGSDGVDAQWECKTDMDKAFRLGQVEVSCEGYNHPDDPYVLKGSCGLEFTLELTQEGKHRQGGSHHGSEGFGSGSLWGVAVLLLLLLLLGYGVYKLFLSGNTAQGGQEGDAGDNRHGFAAGPPPPGFRPDFTSPSSPGCAGANPGAVPGSGTGGGFWTGLGTGGMLGYLFGSQRGQPHSYTNPRPHVPQPFSSGTHTATAFGGTKRR